MVSLDTNSSITQPLVDQLVGSSTINGAFSLSAFESELSSVVTQVITQAVSGAVQATPAGGSQPVSGSNSSSGEAGSGSSQNLVATQSQPPAATPEPILAMFGGGAAPVAPPVVFQSANLLVASDGEVPLVSAGTGDAPTAATSPVVPASAAAITPAATVNSGVDSNPEQSKMVQRYDPFWGDLAGPLVPASGTTWANASTGAAYDSGAVTAGMESRFGAGTARMLTVLYDQFGPQAYNDYVSQHPNIDFSKLNFATLPPMTAFQMYGPGDSFADPNNQNQYCYFDESGVEHLSGAGQA